MSDTSDSVLEISRKHGKAMYQLALKHAIETIEILGDNALPHLKEQLEKEESDESQ